MRRLYISFAFAAALAVAAVASPTLARNHDPGWASPSAQETNSFSAAGHASVPADNSMIQGAHAAVAELGDRPADGFTHALFVENTILGGINNQGHVTVT